jgi:hypothetical protein
MADSERSHMVTWTPLSYTEQYKLPLKICLTFAYTIYMNYVPSGNTHLKHYLVSYVNSELPIKISWIYLQYTLNLKVCFIAVLHWKTFICTIHKNNIFKIMTKKSTSFSTNRMFYNYMNMFTNKLQK